MLAACEHEGLERMENKIERKNALNESTAPRSVALSYVIPIGFKQEFMIVCQSNMHHRVSHRSAAVCYGIVSASDDVRAGSSIRV